MKLQNLIQTVCTWMRALASWGLRPRRLERRQLSQAFPCKCINLCDFCLFMYVLILYSLNTLKNNIPVPSSLSFWNACNADFKVNFQVWCFLSLLCGLNQFLLHSPSWEEQALCASVFQALSAPRWESMLFALGSDMPLKGATVSFSKVCKDFLPVSGPVGAPTPNLGALDWPRLP